MAGTWGAGPQRQHRSQRGAGRPGEVQPWTVGSLRWPQHGQVKEMGSARWVNVLGAGPWCRRVVACCAQHKGDGLTMSL